MPRFSATLLDHAAHPRNGGDLTGANRVGNASLAGEAPRITIMLHVEGNVVEEAMFRTFGCGVTIAACSMLTLKIVGQSVERCREMTPGDLIDSLEGIPADKQFCARLAIEALRNALDQD